MSITSFNSSILDLLMLIVFQLPNVQFLIYSHTCTLCSTQGCWLFFIGHFNSNTMPSHSRINGKYHVPNQIFNGCDQMVVNSSCWLPKWGPKSLSLYSGTPLKHLKPKCLLNTINENVLHENVYVIKR